MQQRCTVFPERLIELRINSGLSRQQFADKLGISRASLEYYEKGKRTPDIDVLYRISDLFNITADYLIGRTDKTGASMDINAICEYTGLSEKAINKLNEYKVTSNNNESISSVFTFENIRKANKNFENMSDKEIELLAEHLKNTMTNISDDYSCFLYILGELLTNENDEFYSVIMDIKKYIETNGKLSKYEPMEYKKNISEMNDNDMLAAAVVDLRNVNVDLEKEQNEFRLFKITNGIKKVIDTISENYLQFRGVANGNSTKEE